MMTQITFHYIILKTYVSQPPTPPPPPFPQNIHILRTVHTTLRERVALPRLCTSTVMPYTLYIYIYMLVRKEKSGSGT